MPMNLNNRGDHIYLRDPNDIVFDEFQYGPTGEGTVVETNH